jgi:hypothetical protein
MMASPNARPELIRIGPLEILPDDHMAWAM